MLRHGPCASPFRALGLSAIFGGAPFYAVSLAFGLLASCADANQAREMPRQNLPSEGPIGPDTYVPVASLIDCIPLDPYPPLASQPWNPTVEEAVDFCSARPSCGGIVYTPAFANLVQAGVNRAIATFCRPNSFIAAGDTADVFGIALVRYVYQGCDLRIPMEVTEKLHYGSIVFQRKVCVRLGRGFLQRHDKIRRQRLPPKAQVTIGDISYEVGRDVFVNAKSARSASADGSSHEVSTSSGVTYYMPGSSHATRNQAEKPFVRDRWYPLYRTKAGAQAASTRGGGNGLAHEVGPMSRSGLPLKWSTAPFFENLWMPSDGSHHRFMGDYVEPFALDGYFPLYRDEADAAKVSDNGLAQSHGPGSFTGHPLSWSTGQREVLYMPQAAQEIYYGNYSSGTDSTLRLYDVVPRPSSGVGISIGSLSAAWAATAESRQSCIQATSAARAILSIAPNWMTQ